MRKLLMSLSVVFVLCFIGCDSGMFLPVNSEYREFDGWANIDYMLVGDWESVDNDVDLVTLTFTVGRVKITTDNPKTKNKSIDGYTTEFKDGSVRLTNKIEGTALNVTYEYRGGEDTLVFNDLLFKRRF